VSVGYSPSMLRIKDSKRVVTGNAESRVSFDSEGWSRYLLIDGKQAYMLGGKCQTCAFMFERRGGANQAVQVDEAVEALRRGINSLDDPLVSLIGRAMPEGEYIACLMEGDVRQVELNSADDYFVTEGPALFGEDMFYCLPHDPRIAYYRAGEEDLSDGRRLFQFVVPMFPAKWLKMTTIADYIETLRTKSSGTAVCISVLDARSPAVNVGSDWPHTRGHLCLAHYVLDGHHKLNAAAESGQPLSLLSFLAVTEGVSTQADVETVVNRVAGKRFG